MIGRLRGILLAKQAPHLLIDVTGVAYEVQASMTTFYRLPDVDHEVILHTHFVVREDAQQLYGFYEMRERSLFRSLIKVNGVGPKMALTILSSIEPDNFVRCVMDNDTASLVNLPGVGKKTAERLIIEMRDRLADWHDDPSWVDTKLAPMNSSLPTEKKSLIQEAISALMALGYKSNEATRVIQQIGQDFASSEELIRLALRSMAK